MVTVYVRDNESIESALKRFSKQVQDSRILLEVKERQAYVKPSDQRRRDAAAGKGRCQKKQRKTEKMLEFLSNNKVPPRRPRTNNFNNSNNPNGPTQPYNKERRPQQQSSFRNDRQKRTVYVGGLSYGTIEESLFNHFSTVAKVESAKIILDRETQKSRGFGFVELSSEADVQAVIDAFHETEFEGRRVVVSANKTKEEKEKERKAAAPPPPVAATEEDLLDLQAKFNSKAV